MTKPFSVLVLGLAVLSLLAVFAQGPRRSVPPPASAPFSVMEATITEMRAALEQRRVTSREIVMQYLARIAFYKNRLHAAITVNVRAVEEADERDRERATGGVRGPLHGIPIALKDNIQTTDMPTTGGALAFDGFVPNTPTLPFPEGFNARSQPYGVSFTGMACSEPKLLKLAYAFEQATKRRVPPPGAP